MKKRIITVLLVVALAVSLGLVPAGVLAADAGLVAVWHFDDNANDGSGNNNHGTVSGAVYTDGYFGKALSFDGVDDYVEVGHRASLIPSEITIEAWIYPSSWTHTPKAVALVTKRTAFGNGYFLFHYGATSPITFDWGGSSGDNRWKTGYNPPLNTWTHLAVTRNSAGRALYVNGVLYSSTTHAGAPALVSTTSPLRVGCDSMAARYPFQGTIDEVRIWNRALTDDEIAYHYALQNWPIDIKPGSDPNSINLGSNGVVPVAILSDTGFDASTVDPTTVSLAGAGVRLKGKSGNTGSLKDVDGDGDVDLVVQVNTDALELSDGDVEAVLTAHTYSGLAIKGSDTVRIVPP